MVMRKKLIQGIILLILLPAFVGDKFIGELFLDEGSSVKLGIEIRDICWLTVFISKMPISYSKLKTYLLCNKLIRISFS